MGRRPIAAIAAVVAVVVVGVAATVWLWVSQTYVGGPGDCPLVRPAIDLRHVAGSSEAAFFVEHSDFYPAPNVSELSYELAQYAGGSDFLGPGEIIRSGLLSSLNTTGDLQYHDMAAEGELNGGNDFFILRSPPPLAIQLRILNGTGNPIAW